MPQLWKFWPRAAIGTADLIQVTDAGHLDQQCRRHLLLLQRACCCSELAAAANWPRADFVTSAADGGASEDAIMVRTRHPARPTSSGPTPETGGFSAWPPP